MTVVALPTPESQLIRHCLTGDEKAFRELIKQFSPLVFRFIYQMTQNYELTDELTQEVFVKVYRNLKAFDANRPFKPWLLRIASNTANSALRKKNPVVSLELLEESGQWGELAPSQIPDTTLKVDQQYSSDMVLKALQELDTNYKEALLLRYTEDLSYEEISNTLDVPLNTVRTWIKRGRDRLRTLMKGVEL